MITLTFLVKNFIDFYIILILLRLWMQWVHCDIYHPFMQYIIKITQSIVTPLVKIIPIISTLDNNFLLLILSVLLAIIKFPLLMLIEIRVLIFDPIYLMVGMLTLLKAIGKLFLGLVILRSLFSLVSNDNSKLNRLIDKLIEPLMYQIRCILPAINGIDYSLIISITLLYILNYFFKFLFFNIWYSL